MLVVDVVSLRTVVGNCVVEGNVDSVEVVVVVVVVNVSGGKSEIGVVFLSSRIPTVVVLVVEVDSVTSVTGKPIDVDSVVVVAVEVVLVVDVSLKMVVGNCVTDGNVDSVEVVVVVVVVVVVSVSGGKVVVESKVVVNS